ncbi:LTA synthase family protein [Azotobacter salinestris]|uniref:LTA synthase family protein n=1 Tax=Azotobacter salinestris TaxID=69964 RepID=UPI0032DF17E5
MDSKVEFFVESICHALMLSLFFLIASFCSVFFWRASWGVDSLFFSIGIDLAFLVGLSVFVAAAASILKWRVLVVRGWVLLLYFFVLAQFQYQSKTGYFFSLEMVAYVVDGRFEALNVLSSGLNVEFWFYLFGVLFLFMVPVLEANGVLPHSKILHVALACVVLVAVVSMPYSWAKDWRGSSLFHGLIPESDGVYLGGNGVYSAGQRSTVGTVVGDKVNILIVVLESTRARSLPGFGVIGRQADMPNLVALMEKSRVYERAYTVTPHTSKALVGLLCGIHPNPVAGIVEARGANIPTVCLPELLKGVGYRSLFIQSATEDFEQRRSLVKNFGFDKFLAKEQIGAGFKSFGYFGLDEMAMLDPLREWWRQDQRPMLTVLLTSMTHHPYEGLAKREEGTEEERYLEVLSYSDRFLGRLFDELKSSGKLSDTVVFIVGDHGEAFGEHGRMQHSVVPFEEVVHVPLMVFDGRGQIVPGRDQGLRQHIDILPSVVSLIVGEENILPGKSIFSSSGHERIFINCLWSRSCLSMVEGKDKWIYFPSLKRVFKFSVLTDPAEATELEVDKEQAESVIGQIMSHQGLLRDFYSPSASTSACEKLQGC